MTRTLRFAPPGGWTRTLFTVPQRSGNRTSLAQPCDGARKALKRLPGDAFRPAVRRGAASPDSAKRAADLWCERCGRRKLKQVTDEGDGPRRDGRRIAHDLFARGKVAIAHLHSRADGGKSSRCRCWRKHLREPDGRRRQIMFSRRNLGSSKSVCADDGSSADATALGPADQCGRLTARCDVRKKRK